MGQVSLIWDSSISSLTISLGTQAGDQAEMEAIRVAFSQTRSRGNPLHVTSVKANIGHAEAASGAASLAKLILMFHHRTIPPQISLKQLNPRIPDLMKDFIEVNYESSPWAPQSNRRLASLSNFGAAGSNVAVILEEPPVLSSRCPTTTLRAFILGLSCDSEAALHKLRAAYLDHIDCLSDDSPHLADLCYTATARRQLYSHRLIASGTTKESLRESLSKSPVTQANEVPGKTIFVFSGLGGQYRGMGQGLYNGLPEFRKLVDHCERILLSRGYPCVRHILESDGTPLEEAGVQMVHLAMFVLEYSLACLWMEWGVLPDAVVGHRCVGIPEIFRRSDKHSFQFRRICSYGRRRSTEPGECLNSRGRKGQAHVRTVYPRKFWNAGNSSQSISDQERLGRV